RRLGMPHDLSGDRGRKSAGQLLGALSAVLPPEVPVADVHVREEVRDRARVRVSLHVVEEHRVTAVEMLLLAGELEVAVDLDVGLEEKTFAAEPLDRRGQGADVILARGRSGEV